MRVVAAVSVLLLAVPAVASAQSMNAETFHRRADALMKKGPMAIFAPGEIRALTAEGQASGIRAGELRKARIAQGGKPRFCPPPGSKIKIERTEFMTRLAAIPAAERARIDMTEATTRIMAAKYPCPA